MPVPQPARAPDAAAPPSAALAGLALAVFAAALWLRLTGLGTAAVSLDEVYTQFAASRDWLGMVLDRASRGHMPTYFAVAKVTVPDVSDIVALRRPAAVADAVAAAVLAAGVARLVSLPAGLWAGALYATGPAFVIWAQNARPYGLLMAFVALGLVAAMALVRRGVPGPGAAESAAPPGADPGRPAETGAGAPRRGPDRAFAAAWSGAVFTLTGGILAYLAVVLTPRLRRGPLWAPAFRARWRRAALVPSVVAGFAYLAVSRPHVYEGADGYWVEKYRPFGLQSLAELGGDLIGGRLRDIAPVQLPPGFEAAVLAVMAAGLAALAIVGARQARAVPALWPVIGLAVGFITVMVAASAVASLLIDRYFLPAWAAVLVLAAVGLARLRPWLQALAGGALVSASAAFALASALAAPGAGPAYPRLAAAFEASGHRDAPLLIGEPFTELRRDILSLRLDEPDLPRPDVHGARPERVRDRRAAGAPAFLAVTPDEWEGTYRALLPPAPCGLATDRGVLVWLGAEGCPAPLAPLPD